jgi:hypothetical protein
MQAEGTERFLPILHGSFKIELAKWRLSIGGYPVTKL